MGGLAPPPGSILYTKEVLLADALITPWQAQMLDDYYNRNNIPAPANIITASVQAAAPTVAGPVFIDTAPTVTFAQFVEDATPVAQAYSGPEFVEWSAPLTQRQPDTPTFSFQGSALIPDPVRAPVTSTPALPVPIMGAGAVPVAQALPVPALSTPADPSASQVITTVPVPTPLPVGKIIQADIIEGGTSAMVFPAVAAAPRLIVALRGAAGIINGGGRLGLPRVGGRGMADAIVKGLALEQVADFFGLGISDLFGADDVQQLEELTTELVDSGYVQWDSPKDRNGNPVEMKYIVMGVNSKADERPYGMGYRPFSKSSVNSTIENLNTKRRPRRARRTKS